MTHHHHVGDQRPVSAHHPRTPEHWEERYGGDQLWSGNVNGALVAEVGDLTPGRALDVGSGEGADSVWLAGQGWEVTALDIAQNAINRTLAAADRAGVKVTGVVAPFTEADLAPASFDLVSALYPVLWKTPERSSEQRLLDLVAPGGSLLFVHHDMSHAAASGSDEAGEHGRDHGDNGFDPTEIVGPDDVRACFTDEWEIVTDGRSERHVATGAGAGHTHDLVLRARRRI